MKSLFKIYFVEYESWMERVDLSVAQALTKKFI